LIFYFHSFDVFLLLPILFAIHFLKIWLKPCNFIAATLVSINIVLKFEQGLTIFEFRSIHNVLNTSLFVNGCSLFLNQLNTMLYYKITEFYSENETIVLSAHSDLYFY